MASLLSSSRRATGGVPASVLLLSAALAVGAGEARAATGAQRLQAGRCAAFVRRVQQQGAATEVARHDLYDGLTGWIAMKSGLSPEDVDALGGRSAPDAPSCEDFGLSAGPLLALEGVLTKVPADRVQGAVVTCFAALRLLDDLADGPRADALRAATLVQTRSLGRLLGYLAKGRKPAPGMVEARVEELRRASPGDPRSGPALGAALDACLPLGVDVALLKRTHGVR
jgi:hypothetical protein